jgi:plastocyanin
VKLSLLAALAALAVVTSVAVATASNAAKGPIRVTRVQVSAKEFWFSLSRRTVVSGPVIVQLVNFGEDDHDLRVRRVGGTRTYKTPDLQPGAYFDLDLKLVPGRYKFWCSIANHESLGMKTFLTVRKP